MEGINYCLIYEEEPAMGFGKLVDGLKESSMFLDKAWMYVNLLCKMKLLTCNQSVFMLLLKLIDTKELFQLTFENLPEFIKLM